MLLRVIMLGSSLPEGCPFREGLFELEMLLDCGERGPLRCLNVRFATDLLHPNFTRDTGICHCHADFLPSWRRKTHLLWCAEGPVVCVEVESVVSVESLEMMMRRCGDEHRVEERAS